MRRRITLHPAAALALALTLAVAALGVSHMSGTYALFLDSERTHASISTASYFGAIPATVDIDPDTLNPKSHGNFITAYIELPEGFDVADIVLSTVTLRVPGVEGSVPAKLRRPPPAVGDHDGDTIPDLMVKFDRPAVLALLIDQSGDVTMIVAGELSDGQTFEGSDVVRVLDPPTPTPSPTVTPTPTATSTPLPAPTDTPEPTATLEATATPKPTATLSPEPTATPTSEPALPPQPSPTPTAASEPTATPISEPTSTPPQPSPTRTAPSEPTATPISEPTPTPLPQLEPTQTPEA